MLSKIISFIIIVLLVILIILNCVSTIRQEKFTKLKIKNIKEEFEKENNRGEIRLKPDSSYSVEEIYPFKKSDDFYIKNYDKKILSDPFTAPRDRVENSVIHDLDLYKNFNLSTHGKLNDYHIIGVLNLLTTDSQNKNNNIENNATEYNNILQLYGRQKYPYGNEYEYYTMITSGNQTIKIPIKNKHKKELYDGDEIFIKELNRKYIVKKYPMEEIEYIPL